jgi:FHS family L-fucose permease-like MFS transporter
MLGGAAIFLYVGAEVSIGTQMALFLHDAAVWDIPLQSAGYYVSLYWLGAMIGRFFGSGLMVRFPAYRLLAAAAACAVILCFVAFLITGVNAGYAVIAIGLFNSIMFPAIFSLTLERSTATPEATSGYLCTAIVGGALVPLLTGAVSDTNGYATSFIVPMTCYVLLFAFAIFATRGRPEHSQS